MLPLSNRSRTSETHQPQSESAASICSTFTDSALDVMSHKATVVSENDPQSSRTLPSGPASSDSRQPAIQYMLSNYIQALTGALTQSDLPSELATPIDHLLSQSKSILHLLNNQNKPISQHSEVPQGRTSELDERKDDELCQQEESEDEWIDESELVDVRHNLAATLQEMRERQQEQRHIHELAVGKLESMAQKCLDYEARLDTLTNHIDVLQHKNDALRHDNTFFQDRIAELEADTLHKDVAVNAMSSAVAGLEGYIDTATPSRACTPVPSRPAVDSKRQRIVVTRGRGRFRGRYLVDENDLDTSSHDLHDGIKAWLRGFRDVEEELRSSSPVRRQAVVHKQEHIDWRPPQRVETCD